MVLSAAASRWAAAVSRADARDGLAFDSKARNLVRPCLHFASEAWHRCAPGGTGAGAGWSGGTPRPCLRLRVQLVAARPDVRGAGQRPHAARGVGGTAEVMDRVCQCPSMAQFRTMKGGWPTRTDRRTRRCRCRWTDRLRHCPVRQLTHFRRLQVTDTPAALEQRGCRMLD